MKTEIDTIRLALKSMKKITSNHRRGGLEDEWELSLHALAALDRIEDELENLREQAIKPRLI